MKTVRFTEVVEASGRPEIHLSWTPPERDEVLQSALKQHRVVTLHQHTRGSKKDFGVVGLDVVKGAQFLVFRRSLRRFEGRQIVGIHYDLLDDALSVGPTPHGRTRGPRQKPPTRPDNVVPFRLPEIEEKPEERPRGAIRPKPKPTQPKAKAKPKAPRKSMEKDPVKREVREALNQLALGRVASAIRRLERLLKPS